MSKKSSSTDVTHKLSTEDIAEDLAFLEQEEETLDELIASDACISDEPKSVFHELPQEFLTPQQEAELSCKIQKARKTILSALISTEPGLEFIVETNKSKTLYKPTTSRFFKYLPTQNPKQIYTELQQIWQEFQENKNSLVLINIEKIVEHLPIRIGKIHEIVQYV
ncbi:MAG: hypothetical protein Q7K43_06875, partial [Candidatus Woesearchaeota archaeon]|nr:hypothetical protein [Candidatus Woesearchaeota archaeon]